MALAQIFLTGIIRGFSFNRKGHSDRLQESRICEASTLMLKRIAKIVFWASSTFCAVEWYFERNCEPRVGPDTWVCPANINHQPPCHANEAVSLAPILTMFTVFLIKSVSKANHPMVLFIDNLEKDTAEIDNLEKDTAEVPFLRKDGATPAQAVFAPATPAPAISPRENSDSPAVGFRIGHVHRLKLDLILGHYPFVGQFCGCCVRSSLWQTLKRQYPTKESPQFWNNENSPQFVLAQKCLWDNHLKGVKGLSHGRGELAGGKYLCYSCRNNFEEVPAEQSYANWFKQLDQSIILLVPNSDVYGSEVPSTGVGQQTVGKTKTVILRRLKNPDSTHSDVQNLPFTLKRTRAANGTWKLEPEPNKASVYEVSQLPAGFFDEKTYHNCWADFSSATGNATANGWKWKKDENYFLDSINGVKVSETKYEGKLEEDDGWKQLETDLCKKRKKKDLTLTFSIDKSIMKVLTLKKREKHGFTFHSDSTRVKSDDKAGRFENCSLHAVIDANKTTHRAKDESCRRDLGEFLNEMDNSQLPRPIHLVFKPQKKELDWKEIAMKVVRLSSFLAELNHKKLRLCSEWIMPVGRGVIPVLILEWDGLSSDYSMAGHRYGAIEVMACISTCFWTRVLLRALVQCRVSYLEQAEAQKILSILYQKPQHNCMPYEAWLESLQAHVGKNNGAATDIQELIEMYNTRPGEPLLDFTHPSQGRMQMWMYSMCRSTMRVHHKIHQARCTTVVGVLLAGVFLMTVIGFSRHCKLNSRLP
jgi:hypothetical protein